MTFGEKLQKLRKEKGWTQEELAEQITVSRQALSRWELGTAIPDTENVLQISRLFGVSTDYLLHDEYESDGDLPAVHTANAALTERHKTLAWTISGGVLAGLSALGLIILGILASVNPALVLLDDRRYEGLSGFLMFHSLGWLFGLMCILLLAGLGMLLGSQLYARFKNK